jgi:hypothetical protein
MLCKRVVIPLLLGIAFFPHQTSSQEYLESGRKAVIHEHATAKRTGGQGLGIMSSDKCCTVVFPPKMPFACYCTSREAQVSPNYSRKKNSLGVHLRIWQIAMFLGTMELPSGGETEALGQQALSCCREVLCSKFVSPQDCAWISSGDDTWKNDLSNDLDRVEVREYRVTMPGPSVYTAAALIP